MGGGYIVRIHRIYYVKVLILDYMKKIKKIILFFFSISVPFQNLPSQPSQPSHFYLL